MKKQYFLDFSIKPQPPLFLQEEPFLRVEGLQCLWVLNILHGSQRIAFVFNGFRRKGWVVKKHLVELRGSQIEVVLILLVKVVVLPFLWSVQQVL